MVNLHKYFNQGQHVAVVWASASLSVRREFESHQRLPLFPQANICIIIAQTEVFMGD